MAVRVFNQFHTKGARSPKMLASVVAMLAWKLAIESVKRMRKAYYDIDAGKPYFDFVCEFLVFLAHSADRIAYRSLDAEQRAAFTTALAIRLAEMVEESHEALLGDAAPGTSHAAFIELFNRRGGDYGEYDYGPAGPDFGFKRMFASALREILPEKDKLWVVDQAMDIEAPDAIKALEKAMAGLFGGEAATQAGTQDRAKAQTSSGMGGE
ncbi:MAG: hypothetical protein KJ787_13065 [Gammaproteobacteria bacterium]|nr:hypothetical protein [Gammaproteobacteria bacterium]MBU1647254.1 hypothetical protein [Gammaproteobacteria bacterium]MBU1972766.1 hypothetical protein [Gammaproteobacteria bacterium]